VFHDLEVPDFWNGKSTLAMSGLLLSSPNADEVTTPVTDVSLGATLETPPAVRRLFTPVDDVMVFAEIYDTNKSAHVDVITTRVTDANGKAVLQAAETVPSARINGGRADTAYPHKVRLRLKGLLPGSYLLRVDVLSQTKGNPTATREVPITIG
jgi:hypothetical protein